MPYNITVVTENGKTMILSTSGDIPEGTHILTGTDVGNGVDIQVRRRDQLGRFVVSAQHFHSRADYPVPVAGFFSTFSPAELQIPKPMLRKDELHGPGGYQAQEPELKDERDRQ